MLLVLILTLDYDALGKQLAIQLNVIITAFIISNFILLIIHKDKLENRRSYNLVLFLDISLVCLLSALLGKYYPVFFILYLITVLAATFSNSVSVGVAIAVFASLTLGVIGSITEGPNILFTQTFLLRASLLVSSSIMVGYMSEAMEADRKIAIQSNPTTGLPGYTLIRVELEHRIKSGKPFAVCYIDNDNFKAYNDYYGFARGDRLIKATSDVIIDSVREICKSEAFIGHVGGDDFIVITNPDNVDTLAVKINISFSKKVREFYDQPDLDRGYIKTHDRKGVTDIFPVMALSIAVVSNVSRNIKNPDQIAEIAAILKKKAKTHKSRVYVSGDTGFHTPVTKPQPHNEFRHKK